MQRLVTVSESTVIRHLQPRILVDLVPLCKHRLRYGFVSWKYSQTSPSTHQRLQPFHSTVSRQTMSTTTSTFYDLKADLPGGETYDFEQLKGKVVLVVNVASQWYAQSY